MPWDSQGTDVAGMRIPENMDAEREKARKGGRGSFVEAPQCVTQLWGSWQS